MHQPSLGQPLPHALVFKQMELRHSDNSGDAASSHSAGLRSIFDAFLPRGSEGFSALDMPIMMEEAPLKDEEVIEVGSASHRGRQPLKRDFQDDDLDGEELTGKF